MKKMETSLLTEELDDAISWYQLVNQENATARVGQNILYYTRRFLLSQWDPLTTLEENANLACIEAAAKNDTVHLEQLLALPYINDEAKYYALVAAIQGDCSKAIKILLKVATEEVVKKGIDGSYTYSSADKQFKEMNYKTAQTLEEPLHARLGMRTPPNVLIDAACHDRLDVIQHVQDMPSVKNRLCCTSYGYHTCLRAAESGSLSVMNELLKDTEVQQKMIGQGDALRFAAMNGRLNVVNRLLEFPLPETTNIRDLITHAVHTGTVEVLDRLLKIEAVDEFLNYSGDNQSRIRDIEEVAQYACYYNNKKYEETAARMLHMLLKYPVVAQFAEKRRQEGSGVVWEALQEMERLSIKRQKVEAVVVPVKENTTRLRA